MNSGRRTARQEEEYHVLRRNAELRKQEQWNNVAQYFKTWDVKASKYAAWTSPLYFKQSEEARTTAEKREKRQQELNDRREKLRQLLDAEQRRYQDDLKRPIHSRDMPLEELKSINYELKRRSEELRKREAQLLEYHRWKQQQKALKDFDRRQHLEFMKKSWIDQVKEREAARERQRQEEYLRAKEEELKLKKKEEEEIMCQKRKEEEIKHLKNQIKIQMEAVKESVQKYKELEKQEAEERNFQNRIEEMITQRKLAERKQADKQLAAYWTRQYQLKLQKKAKEMEEEITQDQKMLEKLNKEIDQEAKTKAETRMIAKNEMKSALRELQLQKQRELLRQKDYEHMFFEEAKKAWEVQEHKWLKEQRARDSLMKEVLETIKKQVEEKLRTKSAEKAQALEEREELLRDVNDLYRQCSQREQEVKLSKNKYCKELDNQVKEKTTEKAKMAFEESLIEKQHEEAEKEDEQRLAMEIEKMKLNNKNYKPQDFRRQRVLWW